MINKKVSIITTILLGLLLVGVPAILLKHKKPLQQPVVITGLTEGQQKSFQQNLSGALTQFSHIKKGDRLVAEGRLDYAMKEYQTAFSMAKSTGAKGEALRSIANLYEIKRNYKKALEYIIIERDKYTAEWARGPLDERIKYLEYADQGEYDLAVEHAEKAIKAEASLPDSNGKPRADYIKRLDDIKGAKDYIISLKKTK